MKSDTCKQDSQHQCCFCGEAITTEPAATLTMPLKDGGSQSLKTHWQCFRSRLHKSVPMLEAKDYE